MPEDNERELTDSERDAIKSIARAYGMCIYDVEAAVFSLTDELNRLAHQKRPRG